MSGPSLARRNVHVSKMMTRTSHMEVVATSCPVFIIVSARGGPTVRRIRNWRAPASPRPRYAVDARHLHTGLLAAAVARGQEPLALPAPLPVELAAGPQLERDAPLLIIVFSFVYK